MEDLNHREDVGDEDRKYNRVDDGPRDGGPASAINNRNVLPDKGMDRLESHGKREAGKGGSEEQDVLLEKLHFLTIDFFFIQFTC